MGASDIRAGKAYVEVYSRDNTAPGMKSIFNRLGNFAFQIQNIGGLVANIGSRVSGAVSNAVDYGSRVKDAADRTGLTAEAVQELGYAASQSGASIESLETGIKMMQKAISTGSDGFGGSLEKMGLSLATLRTMAPDQQFMAIAEAVSKIQDPAERTRMAMEMFGRSGAELIPLLSEGAAGLEKLRAKARASGLVLTASEIATLEQFGDELDTLARQFQVIGAQVGLSLIPVMQSFVSVLSEIAPAMQKAREGIWQWIRANSGAAGFFGSATAPPISNPVAPAVQNAIKDALPSGPMISGFGASTLDAASATADIQKNQLRELKEIKQAIKEQKQGGMVPQFGA